MGIKVFGLLNRNLPSRLQEGAMISLLEFSPAEAYEHGFYGLPDVSDSMDYIQAYVTGAADSARQSLNSGV